MTDLERAETVRETERARLRALVAGDVAAARKVHAPDFQLVTPRGVALTSAEYLEEITSGLLKYASWEPGEMAVRLHGDTALVRYQARLDVVYGGTALPPMRCWHTDTYQYADGRWMVVWSQATAIL